MSYNTLKALVNSKVYENTEQRITGGDMNDVLQSAIASLGAHYQMGGLVSPTDHITVGDEPVVFIATTPGTYTYFGSQVVADGEVALLVWSGTAWSKQTPDISTRTEVNQLGQEMISNLENTLNGNSYDIVEKTFGTYSGYWGYDSETNKMSGFVADNIRRCYKIDVKYCTNTLIATTNGLFGSTVSKRWMLTDAENNVIASDINASSSLTFNLLLYPNAKYIYFNMFDGSASTITFKYYKEYYYEKLEKVEHLDSLYIAENQKKSNQTSNGLILRLDDSLVNVRNGNVTFFDIPFVRNRRYTIKLVSDSPIQRFLITNSNGVNIVDNNIVAGQIYNIDFYSTTTSSRFNTYIICDTLVTANIEFSIWEYDDELLETRDLAKINKGGIDNIGGYIENNNLLSEIRLTLLNGTNTYFTGVTFKNGHTYKVYLSCDNSITGNVFIRNVNSSINNAKISGTINNNPLLITMESDSVGLSIISDIDDFVCVATIIEEYTTTELGNINLLKKSNFTLPASQSLINDKYIMYGQHPYPVGNGDYYINIRLDREVTISNGYINIYWSGTYDGKSSQSIHITNFTSKLSNNTFTFKATHDITNISLTIWLDELDVAVNGTVELYCKGEDKIIENKIVRKTLSDTNVYLASYTKNNNDGGSGKLFLAMSTDGMNFHKLSDNYIFDANLGNGFLHDIFIIKKGDYFYITATSSLVENNNAIITIFRSKDLQNWSEYTQLLIPVSTFTYEEGNSFKSIWAPEILLLNGNYYFSFAVCEATTPSYIVKGYIADMNDELNVLSNIRQLTLNADKSLYTFDTTIYYDEEKGKYYAYTNDGAIYSSDSIDGTWSAIAMLPLAINGYNYMEGGTIVKDKGFYYIYGDGTVTSGNTPNNMLCFRTPDFVEFELVDTQFDEKIRHPKIITSDCLTKALAEKVFLDNLN